MVNVTLADRESVMFDQSHYVFKNMEEVDGYIPMMYLEADEGDKAYVEMIDVICRQFTYCNLDQFGEHKDLPPALKRVDVYPREGEMVDGHTYSGIVCRAVMPDFHRNLIRQFIDALYCMSSGYICVMNKEHFETWLKDKETEDFRNDMINVSVKLFDEDMKKFMNKASGWKLTDSNIALFLGINKYDPKEKRFTVTPCGSMKFMFPYSMSYTQDEVLKFIEEGQFRLYSKIPGGN